MKQFFTLFLVIFTLGFAPAHASEKQAASYASGIGDDALKVIGSDISADAKRKKLSSLFEKNVDTKWIGRFVMGANWRKMDEKQQGDYIKYYKNFLINQYTTNFQDYAEGTAFEVTNSRPLGNKNDQYLVSMKILRDGAPIMVDYRIREKSKKYHVIDIVVEGVSLLATQRSEFNSVVQRKGVDYLIGRLKAKQG